MQHRAAHKLATRSLAALDRGISTENVAARIKFTAPADLHHDPEGYSLRCYGLETPPMRDRGQAITTWAHMALEQTEGPA
ncbi:hypothetical protein TG4357_02677 [Thalassovita gelatinovora]|uniref:Uncharacterized protein n=2 Tax=Thalassovita gelatinovora TaxID=53501 RepID=A0A0N7LVP2_THAGE|nr:hypothetical protein TG4357_02677 [Thalassovita gelatinovora]SEQ43897.1 hypothetical protein SAMN04488043_105214 [Thalassovita gelatinovora]